MLGDRIKRLREAAGLSQAELARRIGIKQPSLWEIEHGETKTLKAETLMKLAKALKSNAHYIWAGIGPAVETVGSESGEVEVILIYRQLRAENRAAWLAAGHALQHAQPVRPRLVAVPTHKKGRRK